MLPELVRLNRLPAQATTYPYPDEEMAAKNQRESSPWYLPLDGRWRFRLMPNPQHEDAPLADAALDDGDWAGIEVAEAVQGGEPWQNWAVAACDLKDSQAGALTLRRLHNGNAGWSAEIVASSLELTRQGIKGTATVKATWFGFRDGLQTDLAYHQDAWKKGLSFDAYWNTSPKRFGKKTYGWDGPGGGEWKLNTRIQPPPLDGHGEYAVVHRPVLAGMYEYRLEGQRVGDLVAGTVTIKGPDGKEYVCQFLGGVE